MVSNRPDWDEYFLQLADLVATRSTCLRRQVGAVLVKNERIISTGYNGAPRGLLHCLDIGCLREERGIPSGQRYELCRGVHAEQNALINAAFYGVSTSKAVLYCTNQPCIICARMIINAGIIRIVHRGNFDDDLAIKFLKEAGIELLLKPQQSEGVNHNR
ncbi:MAG: cytidine/deoxycytidylate deaminase family protein [Syntrophomonas sp.]|uniref:deoxycytidylate deaminase n=1 Tax=Syntrophomonas sp. TaxID=2053627 RepID=UPI00261E83F0|nr:cytidine/deoxycytidylate deaminase family protein [Syntrophomonas sp.]MDD2509531.1 cytidine/deoxycytidylate deaminase family protein [Syntrophomonas sp.]MDD3878402.1 cytidine/deoxycytidylate deaminase family protein [Syntrophomonas sp.]MDD4625499.1 cytidine/deoxycytidylate deaminase family protein [Syntrophomonas sp.]